MATPANDLFVNARYIYDGITFLDDSAGSTLEPGEATTTPGWQFTTIGTGSLWYKWVADYTGQVGFTVTGTSNNSYSTHYVDVFAGDTNASDDTITSVNRIGTSYSGTSITLTATAGVTYYVRVARSTSASITTFNVTYSVGRAPNTLSSPGTNDLPTLSTGPIHMSALVEITEAIGYAPDSEKVISGFDVRASDQHSNDPHPAYLARLSSGAPVYTCERWVRLRFSPPFGALANVRFWIDNYAPDAGWELSWGTADNYQKPSLDQSSIAVFPIPTDDPLTSNLDLDLVTGGQVSYSPWIVLQARWAGSSPGPIQSVPLNFKFGWSEI